jgi:hypothetical protein
LKGAVGVAERLRRQVVALEIEGSNPSVHPKALLFHHQHVDASARRPLAYLEVPMQSRLTLLLLPLVVLAVACDAFGAKDDGSEASGEGSGSEEEQELETILRPLFGVSQDDSLNVYLGRLPGEFPSDVPLPGGAQIDTAIEVPSGGLVFAFFETDASSEDLIAFYEDELDEERITSVSRGDQNVLRFDVEGDGTAQVIVDEFQSGVDDVGLLLILQYPPPDEEDGDSGEVAFDLPESVGLPEGYPEGRVPLYPDSTVFQADFSIPPSDLGAPEGLLQFRLVLITEDDFEEIIDFYEQALEDEGWEVGDVVDQGALVQIPFENPDNPDETGVISITVFEQDRDLTSIEIQVNAEAGEGES